MEDDSFKKVTSMAGRMFDEEEEKIKEKISQRLDRIYKWMSREECW